MNKISTACVACLLAALAAPVVVSAQEQPAPAEVRRPYRGLFGGSRDPKRSQWLDFTASLFGAYDDDVFAADSGGVGTSAYRQSGWYSGASAGLSYGRRSDRTSFGASADAGISHYFGNNNYPNAPFYRAGVELSTSLGRGRRLSMGETASYSSQYRLGLFVNPANATQLQDPFATAQPDLDLFRQKAYRSDSHVSLSQSLGKRSSISGSYALGLVMYEDDEFDYRAQSAGVAFLQQLTRHATLHIGYGYSTARYSNLEGTRPQRLHSIDAGVDYGRAISLSRRTSIHFSSGSAMWVNDEIATDSPGQDVSFRFVGSAGLNHEMGRTWTASIGYRRGLDFREGFSEPFLSDGVNAALGGMITRRLKFSSSADYSFGTVGFGTDNNYNAFSAGAGLEYGITRNLASYLRYVYYRYDFDQNVSIDPRFVRALDRQGVSFGLSVFVPIIQ